MIISNTRNAIRTVTPFLILIGIGIIFWHKAALPPEGKIINSPDITFLHYFDQVYIQRTLSSNKLPLWCPYYSCGFPFMANPQIGIFYPTTLLLSPLPIPSALGLTLAIHSILAACGAYLLARSFGCSRGASLIPGVTFGYAGFVMAHCYAGHLSMIRSTAYMPIILYFLRRALGFGAEGNQEIIPVLNYKRILWAIGGGISLALQFLGGHPQIVFYTLLSLGLEYIAELIRLKPWERIDRTFWNGAWIGAVKLGIIIIVGGIIAAVQIIPSLELVHQEIRINRGVDFASLFSFPPQNTITLIYPKIQGPTLCNDYEFEFFIGTLPLVLAFWGMLGTFSKKGLSLMLILGFASVLALGKATPLFAPLCAVLPGVTLFRAHTRGLVMFFLAVSVFAAIGIDRLGNVEKKFGKVHLAFLSLFIFIMIGSAIWTFCGYIKASEGIPGWESYSMVIKTNYTEESPSAVKCEFYYALLMLSSSIFIFFVSFWKKLKHKIRILILLSVVTFNIYTSLIWSLDIIDVEKLIFKTNFEDYIIEDQSLNRIWVPDIIFPPNRAILLKKFNVNGDSPLWIQRFARFIHFMTNSEIPKKYIHTVNPQAFEAGPFPFKILNIKYSVFIDHISKKFRFLEHPFPTPRAWIVEAVHVVPEPDDMLEIIKSPLFDPMRIGLLSQEPSFIPEVKLENWQDISLPQYHLDIKMYKAEDILIDVTLKSPGLLILSEIFYPGWEVYVDGRRDKIVCPDYLLRGVFLKEGSHNVRFLFDPVSLKIGLWISASGSLIIIAVVSYYFMRIKLK